MSRTSVGGLFKSIFKPLQHDRNIAEGNDTSSLSSQTRLLRRESSATSHLDEKVTPDLSVDGKPAPNGDPTSDPDIIASQTTIPGIPCRLLADRKGTLTLDAFRQLVNDFDERQYVMPDQSSTSVIILGNRYNIPSGLSCHSLGDLHLRLNNKRLASSTLQPCIDRAETEVALYIIDDYSQGDLMSASRWLREMERWLPDAEIILLRRDAAAGSPRWRCDADGNLHDVAARCAELATVDIDAKDVTNRVLLDIVAHCATISRIESKEKRGTYRGLASGVTVCRSRAQLSWFSPRPGEKDLIELLPPGVNEISSQSLTYEDFSSRFNAFAYNRCFADFLNGQRQELDLNGHWWTPGPTINGLIVDYRRLGSLLIQFEYNRMNRKDHEYSWNRPVTVIEFSIDDEHAFPDFRDVQRSHASKDSHLIVVGRYEDNNEEQRLQGYQERLAIAKERSATVYLELSVNDSKTVDEVVTKSIAMYLFRNCSMRSPVEHGRVNWKAQKISYEEYCESG